MGNSSSVYFKRCGGHFGDSEGEEAEARRRPGGARVPGAGVREQGPWGWGPGGDRAGRRGVGGRDSGGWLGERGEEPGGSLLAAPVGALRGPAPSPFAVVASSASCFSYGVGSAEGSGG